MLLLQLTFCLLFGLAFCQFNFMGSDDFFGQMFGGQQQQHQQQQRPSGSSQWAAHAESVQCSQYLCPDTLDCVGTPSACPCPNEQDIKCLIPDALDKAGATVMCVRGDVECAEVIQLMKKYSK